MNAVEILKNSLKTHQEWLAYLEKYPSAEYDEKHKCIGDAKFHRECITGYEQAISEYEQLQAENKRLKFVVSKFERWYSDSGCPLTETKESFCPRRDELKKEHDEKMEELPEEDRYGFDPSEDCGHESDAGWCYARYYEKLFDDKQISKGEPK